MKINLQQILIFTFFSFTNLANAQIVNNGGTIAVQNGALIKTLGDFKNYNGTIINDGKIEVQGNFINTGTYYSTLNDDSLLMTGIGLDTLNSGGITINYLTINKTTSSDGIRLGSSMVVNKKLDFTSGIFSTDPILNPTFILTSPTSAVYNFGASTEIIGSVKRTGWANGTANVFNQSNMLVTTNGGTAPTDFTVTMLPQTGGGNPSQNEREVTRSYNFAQTAGTGFTANIRYPYLTSELNTNTEANLVPWKLVSSEWNGLTTGATRDLVAHFVNYSGIPAADITQEWKLADPRYTFNVTAYLGGAWINSTGLMRATLSSSSAFPLTQPYNVAPFNYTGTETVATVPPNVVDWILLEFRKPFTGSAVDAVQSSKAGSKACFLLSNGNIVDLDGSTISNFDISKQGAGFVVVRHRNHLAIMSNSLPSNTIGTFTNNFSSLGNVYTKSSPLSPPATTLFPTLPGSGLYGMWSGDVNKDNSVTTADLTPINIAISGPASGNTNVYNPRDLNLDFNITSADLSITNKSINGFANSSSTKSSTNSTEKKILSSHVPQ